eukprot:g20870.t1
MLPHFPAAPNTRSRRVEAIARAHSRAIQPQLDAVREGLRNAGGTGAGAIVLREAALRTQWGNRLGGLLDLRGRFSSAAKRGESGIDFRRDELPAEDLFALIHAPGSGVPIPDPLRTRSIASVRWSAGHAMRRGSAPFPFLRVTVWEGWGRPKPVPDCAWVVRDSPGLRVVECMFCAGCAAVLSAKIPPEVVRLVLLPYLQDPGETYRGLFFASHFYAGIQAEASREFLGRARSFIQEALAAYAAERGLLCCL